MTISQITFYTLTYTDYIFCKCLNLKFFSGFLVVGVNTRLIWMNALVSKEGREGLLINFWSLLSFYLCMILIEINE